MTRREFIHKLMAFGAAVIIGNSWLAKKAVPRKFLWAVGLKKYPGSLKPLSDIQKQSKWSG
jgi:hypothetical protein